MGIIQFGNYAIKTDRSELLEYSQKLHFSDILELATMETEAYDNAIYNLTKDLIKDQQRRTALNRNDLFEYYQTYTNDQLAILGRAIRKDLSRKDQYKQILSVLKGRNYKLTETIRKANKGQYKRFYQKYNNAKYQNF